MSLDRVLVLDSAGAMKLSYEPSQIYSYKFWAKLQSKIRHKLKHKPNFLKLSEAETGLEPAIFWFEGERLTDVATLMDIYHHIADF